MAEYPGEWDLLTASLAVSDLKEPFEAWSFIVLQGLVRDEPGDREAFVKLVKTVAGREPIPGPSDALLIAGELTEIGIATEKAAAPDPFGKVAKKRRQQVESWKHETLSGQSQDQSRWKFWRKV
jgi:hypothetical protein